MGTAFGAGEPGAIDKLGFDDESVPPWIMVPAEQDVKKRIVVLKEGTGLTLHLRTAAGSLNGSGILRIQEQARSSGRGIVLDPVAPGIVFLEAKDQAGGIRASLEITVKARKTLKAALFRVLDKAGRGPKRAPNDVEKAIDVANRLLMPQANIRLQGWYGRGIWQTFEMPTGMPTVYPSFAQSAVGTETPLGRWRAFQVVLPALWAIACWKIELYPQCEVPPIWRRSAELRCSSTLSLL